MITRYLGPYGLGLGGLRFRGWALRFQGLRVHGSGLEGSMNPRLEHGSFDVPNLAPQRPLRQNPPDRKTLNFTECPRKPSKIA